MPAATILVVDDDPSIREHLEWCLKREGYRVLVATQGREGLALAREAEPDLVISDVNMPIMNGFDMVAAMRADRRLHRTPVLVVSSMEDRATYRRAFGLGVADFIVKPVSREDLLDSVAAKLRERAPRDASVLLPRIAGYELIRPLGKGAMSDVFLARRDADGLACAVKVLRMAEAGEDTAELIRRFADECAHLERIRHPNVARVLDHGVADEALFIAMELFEGGDLRTAIADGVSPQVALGFARQIAAGLSAIHAEGLVHRDLKPANVMRRADGSIAIADFGLARRLDAAQRHTREGLALGTPHYMSPEQIDGSGLDGRADYYALGAMLHEMLAGRPMFEAASIEELLARHLYADRPRLPEDASVAVLQPLLDRLIAIDRNERFANSAELLDMLDAARALRFVEAAAGDASSAFIGLPIGSLETVPPFAMVA